MKSILKELKQWGYQSALREAAERHFSDDVMETRDIIGYTSSLAHSNG